MSVLYCTVVLLLPLLRTFNMFSSFSLPFKILGLGASNKNDTVHRPVTVKPVPVHEIETSRDKRARALKHILKINHANHSIIYHSLQFHNHAPHVSAVAFGLESILTVRLDTRLCISSGRLC